MVNKERLNMKTKLTFKNGFLTLIGLLLAIVIICIFGSAIFKTYYRRSKKALPKQGVDAKKYESIIDSTRKQLKNISNKRNEQF